MSWKYKTILTLVLALNIVAIADAVQQTQVESCMLFQEKYPATCQRMVSEP